MYLRRSTHNNQIAVLFPSPFFPRFSCLVLVVVPVVALAKRWVVGGYFVSSSLFNMADLANQFLCPLPPDTESVVVKIINPENNDVAAMAVGSIAPCISAPWWEEVLYRG